MSKLDRSSPLVVFTDLDGTLLDHATYSFEPARPALNALKQLRIPVILASSKTAEEIVPLRTTLELSHCPAIIENGAGILNPGNSIEIASTKYQSLLEKIEQVSAYLKALFVGFSKMTDNEVAAKTGLSLTEARRARARHFSEPVEWNGNDAELEKLKSELLDLGVHMTRGGRFFSLSFGGNKAHQMTKIITEARSYGPCKSVALGDAPNDVEMIENADYGIIIKNASHDGIAELRGEKMGRIFRSSEIGPAGWNEMMLMLLKKLKLGVRDG